MILVQLLCVTPAPRPAHGVKFRHAMPPSLRPPPNTGNRSQRMPCPKRLSLPRRPPPVRLPLASST
ncbi:hypothetical protein CBM2633_A30012 [Cupriavidus taiwanensis]|uniref:Uncharacterized protein n=1 Tax=Cupriavidus taiwanensis TaxID=164546 RepID=A0A375E426_9BURK|nr:hypothetical protein CBM2604_A30140 [Cupriavidus taiwanensis]SOZ26715.1 hypothetical protein CBM2609_A40060 [Cupriavidus taiwanensis]SOZ45438.1 hypothetical protein CBM2610_A50053 [Cupriavidus taiwanensis]SOZ59313.1 hypothetical protein CBM2615_A50034 [Cupriavidus taiwanensis]SOZ59940.1 hypothetical protein CBM2614_A50034 [Cupriavidus taiwanensis]